MKDLNKKVQDIMETIKSIPLSKSTVNNYNYFFKEILKYCQERGLGHFSYSSVDEFMRFQRERMECGKISERTYLEKRKAAWVLANYTETGKIDLCRHRYNRDKLNCHFSLILNNFQSKLKIEVAESTGVEIIYEAKGFFIFLEQNQCRTVSDITPELIRQYILKKSKGCSRSMGRVFWILRRLFRYLREEHDININVSLLLSNHVTKPKKILPCWEEGEAKCFLGAIDTNTLLGKRDYAISQLAIYLGLRASDIMSLKISDIDWEENILTIVQDKTQKKISLPFPVSVGNAVADYILNGRPHVDCEFVFLSMLRPYGRLKNGMGRNIMNRYLEKAGITKAAYDGKTFHAFRRTAGTNMLVSGVPLSTVSQTLGHKNQDSSKRYLSLNDDALRVCCLDIGDYACTKEGLR